MSVDCEAFIGYTITLKEDLNHEDFEFFNNFEENYPQYDYFNNGNNKVKLIVDGMNGCYAKLVYIEKHIDECWITGREYHFPLKSEAVPDEVYDELNEAYKSMYEKDLDKNLIEYALWFHFS